MQTVLMIEDEEIEQKAFEKFMEVYFPEVLTIEGARNGIDGIVSVERENPDLLVVDIQMPDMDGLTLIEKIRQNGYAGKVIIQTAYDYFDYVQKALNLGADAYILKPAGTETIRETIRKCLDQKREEQRSACVQQQDRQQLKEMREYIMQDTIGKILVSDAKRNVPVEQLKQLGIEGIPGFFLAVELLGGDADAEMQEKVSSLNDELSKHLDGIPVILRWTNSRRMTVFISSGQAESLVWYQYTARRAMEKISEYLLLKIGIHVRIGAGKAYSTIEELHSSYRESWYAAAQASQEAPFMFYTKGQAIIRYRDFWERLPLNQLDEEGADDSVAVQIVSDFIKCITAFDMESSRYQVLEFWSAFHEHITRNVIGPEAVNFSSADAIKEIQSLQKHQELQEWLEKRMKQLLHSLTGRGVMACNSILRDVLAYIHRHYREDLSLQQISDQAGISSYYLSHLFREQMGCSVTNYIANLRIRQMIRMLHEKELTVKELAEKLGYRDVGYFSRVVKKNTGKTVGEIKRAIKAEKTGRR